VFEKISRLSVNVIKFVSFGFSVLSICFLASQCCAWASTWFR